MRKKKLSGIAHPLIFFQLNDIFHTLVSISSARIEANNTTIAEYIDNKMQPSVDTSSDIREIKNIENAMSFIEDNVRDYPINKLFVSELHKVIVADLSAHSNGESNYTPGKYRKAAVKISNSTHIIPYSIKVNEYMEKLFAFIQHDDGQKYDLLKTSIAHHRFVWVHLFTNGNGRTARLFIYAMLVKLGFNVNVGRILNPTAISCASRDTYYH